MVQWIVCWSITIVHLVTVSVEDWMKVQRNAVVFTLTVMKTFSVSVIGKVASYSITDFVQFNQCTILLLSYSNHVLFKVMTFCDRTVVWEMQK